ARLLLERPLEVKLKQRNLSGLESRMAGLTKGLPPADQLLQEKIQAKRTFFREQKHDLGKGELMFQKHCAACHQVAGKGAKIGPQLDGIGSRGLDRLLEDMLDPNRNVDQAFRQTTLTLKNGQFINGLVLREEGVLLVLADQQGKEIRVAKDQVEERKLSNVSPMPAGFVDQLSNQEFADLMAYMLANKSMK
ncbi:MAG: c-type cytochrome, partial [Gemmataceae bacterium]